MGVVLALTFLDKKAPFVVIFTIIILQAILQATETPLGIKY